ncbi:DegT/DnrJ/EryC1/StrS family aminotransferase [Dehalococcoidia bacterium]|nr:DegT/DnrJ/EryC1/StrS family aminotransferase [Dehalococcoidia bacterium]
MKEMQIKERIKDLVKDYFSRERREQFVLGKTRIPLNVPSYDWEETCEAIESMLSTYVTMGKKVARFEAMFADYIGVKYATMVNSGSSANLIALSILTNPVLKERIQPADEIITPAVTWATTVFPIINCGAIPVLVDVDLDTFDINPDEVEKAITTKTRAIMPVHLLGNPCEMQRIMKLAQEHNLFVIEDACEAHGAELNGQRVGSFGDLSTFSFFFSHHISTIEGGMVLTNNDEFVELAKALRVFGWIRDLRDKVGIAQRYKDIDPRFLFVNIGYNFRPTEIQGAFGMHQLKKLDRFIEIRRENARFWTQNLEKYSDYLWLHEEREATRHVWFGYPITVKPDAPFTRKELTDFLESNGLETRPVMAGNMDEQPAMRLFTYKKVRELPNSRLIMHNSFFFGNHQGIGKEEREAIVEYIREFIGKRC